MPMKSSNSTAAPTPNSAPPMFERAAQRRSSQRCICGAGQQDMKQPVLKLRRIQDLPSHTPRHDDLVHDPTQAQSTPTDCGCGDSVPWSAYDCCQEKHGSE